VLKGNGCLHWDDGDVWARSADTQFGFCLHAKVCLLRSHLGATAGECGTVVGFTRAFVEVKCAARIVRCLSCDLRPCKPEATTDRKAEAPEHHRARKDSGCRQLNSGDVCALGALTVAESRFGFQLHSKVSLLRGYLGAAAGEFGIVVGFTRAFVEVKCAARIVRCSGYDLQLCEPEAAAEEVSAAAIPEVSDRAEPPAALLMAEPKLPVKADASAAAFLEESDKAEPEDGSAASWEAPKTWGDLMRSEELDSEIRCRQAPRSWSEAVRLGAKVDEAAAPPMKATPQQGQAPATRRKEVLPRKPATRAMVQVRTPRPAAAVRAALAVASNAKPPTPARAAPTVKSSLRPPPMRVAPAVATTERLATPARTAPVAASSIPPSRLDSADASEYTGYVKQSRGSMAWLGCDALLARFPHRDIFLHKTDMAGGFVPRQGPVVFRLVIDDFGNPKAVRARQEGASDEKRMSCGAWRRASCGSKK